jgi:hypothetical protein
MNMKIASTKVLAAFLFAALAAAPLSAQTNAPAVSATSNAVATPAMQSTADDSAAANPAPPKPEHKKKKSSNTADEWAERLGISPLLVPLLVPLYPFAMVVAIIAIAAYSRHRRHKMANETLRAMIEKGIPITPELVDSLKAKRSWQGGSNSGIRQRNDMRSGIILTGIGVGLVMLCGKPGWIVLFLGVAFMVIGMLNVGKGNDHDDQHAFGELVRRHQSPVRAFLTRMTRGDVHLADDLAQETFLKAWQKLYTFRGGAKFSTWLFGIAFNEFRAAARQRKELALEEMEAPPRGIR